MTLIREILACILGLICGSATAAGVVALISSLGIIPRIVGKSSTAKHIKLYENMLLVGATLGSIFVIFETNLNLGNQTFLQGGFLIIAGVFIGIFVGCLAAALAEVIQIWPILYRRTKVKHGMNITMTFFAIGKMAGGLYFFLMMKYLV